MATHQGGRQQRWEKWTRQMSCTRAGEQWPWMTPLASIQVKLQHISEITNTQQGRLPAQPGLNLGGTRMGSPDGTRPGDHKWGHLWVEKGPRWSTGRHGGEGGQAGCREMGQDSRMLAEGSLAPSNASDPGGRDGNPTLQGPSTKPSSLGI